MKILMVSDCPTHPVNAGNREGIINMRDALESLSCDVHFLYIDRISIKHRVEMDNVIPMMKESWGDKLYIYKEKFISKLYTLAIRRFRKLFCGGYEHCDDQYPSLLHRTINKLNNTHHFDGIIVNYYFLSKALERTTIPIKALFTHDYFANKGLLVGNKYVDNNIRVQDEAKAIRRSPHVFAVNDGEVEYFKRLSPLSTIYNIYSFYHFHSISACYNHNIVFLSGSNVFNQNGLQWFLDEIFPAIVNKYPDCRLKIGGSICNVLKGQINNEYVDLLGRIEDPAELYSMGDVAINPTYQGTGLKIKTFEAISYGKVVMTHPHSKDGVFNKDVVPIFSSESSEEWLFFLEKVWNSNDYISEIKERDKKYIEDLNNYIISEYKRFLNSKYLKYDY